MSDELFDLFDDEDTNGTNGQQTSEGSRLRQYAEKMKARAEAAEAEASTLRAEKRRSEFSEVLSGAGKDPAAVSLIPADITDADGVTKWLETNGSVIRDVETPKTEEVKTDQEQHEETQQGLSDEEAAQLAAVSGAPGGSPAGAQQTQLDQLKNAESEEEFYKMLNSFGSQQQ